jgi:D-glycero-D-manno-heptose 1,7-bisphosphate phosphatase
MLVILDRDGVINEDSDQYIKSPDEWHAIDGSLAAISSLNRADIHVVVATNQSGVGRGLFSAQVLTDIHAKMHRELEKAHAYVDRVYVCPHHPDDHCKCRKPAVGLFEQIKADYSEDFKHAVLVGDAVRDIEAAVSAGCTAALVRTGKGERTLKAHPELKKSIPIYQDLKEAAAAIIKNKGKNYERI